MNSWNNISDIFDTHGCSSEIDPSAADNILIAWPSILQGITLAQTPSPALKALDYGCGAGGFCGELAKIGYSVIGCDSSQAMLSIARKNLSYIAFHECSYDHFFKWNEGPFDLICSLMVLQFIEDIERCIRTLKASLRPGGIFAFAVFNPKFVQLNHGPGQLFSGFADPCHPTFGFMHIRNEGIPVFIRTSEEYDAICNALGHERIYLDEPPFNDEFKRRYPQDVDTTYSEYLILVYRSRI